LETNSGLPGPSSAPDGNFRDCQSECIVLLQWDYFFDGVEILVPPGKKGYILAKFFPFAHKKILVKFQI
jgi:hypothetical protein